MINNIPDKIKMGCYTYNIDLTDQPIIIENSTNYAGSIDYIKNEIKIKKDMHKEQQIQVLWHEILHGIISYFELTEEDLKDEEKLINTISKGILMILKDNNIS